MINNLIKMAVSLLLLFSCLTLVAQENEPIEDITVILTTSPKTSNGGIYIYEYQNEKGDYTKAFFIVNKEKEISEMLTHVRIPKKNLADGVKFERDIHWMDVKRLSTSKVKDAIDIDSLYPTWTKKTAKAFIRKINNKRVWLIDRSEPRNNSSSVIIYQVDPIVGW